MITIFRDHNLSEQTGSWKALVDHLVWHRRGDDLASAVRPHLAHVDQHLEVRRHVLEHLAALLAHLAHSAGSGRELLFRGRDANLLARQMRGQGPTPPRLAKTRHRGRRRLLHGRRVRLADALLELLLLLPQLVERERELMWTDALLFLPVELLEQLGNARRLRVGLLERAGEELLDGFEQPVLFARIEHLCELGANVANAEIVWDRCHRVIS